MIVSPWEKFFTLPVISSIQYFFIFVRYDLWVDEKVYAFIDNQNLYKSIRSLGWELDFARFRIFLKHKFRVSKAILFIGYIKENEDFYTKLSQMGYYIVFKEVLKTKHGYKGNIDAELVLHAAKIEYPNYTKAVFVSGDGDFKCLYDDLEKEGKLYRLLIPSKKSQSYLLKSFKQYKTYLEDLKETLGR